MAIIQIGTLQEGPWDGWEREIRAAFYEGSVLLLRGWATAKYEWMPNGRGKLIGQFVGFFDDRGRRLRRDGSRMPARARKR